MKAVVLLTILSSIGAFKPVSKQTPISKFEVNAGTPTKKPKGGAGFNYDASNYQDSNSGNYRRLSDQLAAVKAEEEQLKREREELLRKEQMAAMFLKKENDLFWNTPPEEIVGTSDKYFIPPAVLQVIDDLDNELIGLKPVSFYIIILLFDIR